jgi:hypothetical protein
VANRGIRDREQFKRDDDDAAHIYDSFLRHTYMHSISLLKLRGMVFFDATEHDIERRHHLRQQRGADL